MSHQDLVLLNACLAPDSPLDTPSGTQLSATGSPVAPTASNAQQRPVRRGSGQPLILHVTLKTRDSSGSSTNLTLPLPAAAMSDLIQKHFPDASKAVEYKASWTESTEAKAVIQVIQLTGSIMQAASCIIM